MDIHYHLIHEYIEDQMVIIKFMKTKENDADLLTKNLPGNLFDKHAKKCGSMKKLILRYNRKGARR